MSSAVGECRLASAATTAAATSATTSATAAAAAPTAAPTAAAAGTASTTAAGASAAAGFARKHGVDVGERTEGEHRRAEEADGHREFRRREDCRRGSLQTGRRGVRVLQRLEHGAAAGGEAGFGAEEEERRDEGDEAGDHQKRDGFAAREADEDFGHTEEQRRGHDCAGNDGRRGGPGRSDQAALDEVVADFLGDR